MDDEVRSLGGRNDILRNGGDCFMLVCPEINKNLSFINIFTKRSNVGQDRIVPLSIPTLFKHTFTKAENVMKSLGIVTKRTFDVTGRSDAPSTKVGQCW